jgi:zinc transport system ATP-binding protein
MTPPSALSAHGLTVDLFGNRVVNNITFDVPTGSTTAIIGPNGAGKSIMIKAILRLIPKASGKVEIFGVDHKDYAKIAAQVSYIPQRFAFDDQFPLTVNGLFTLKSGRPIGMTAGERAHMHELLHLVGMEQFLDRRLAQLSGGQLQRVLIAYSLVDHPKLLILDEPSAGIDVQGQETVYALLQRIQKEEKLTMVLVSHELEVVMQYADQVLCLNQNLLCVGAPSQVLTDKVLEEMYGTAIGHYHHHHDGD